MSLREVYYLACDRPGCREEFWPEKRCELGSRVEQLASDAGWGVHSSAPRRPAHDLCPDHDVR